MVKSEETNHVEISEVFEEFGYYQVVQYLLVCLAALFVNLQHINYIFVVGDVDYRCRIPECEMASPYQQQPDWWPNVTIDRCSRPVVDPGWQGSCTNQSFTGAIEPCRKWIYANNNTAVTQLDLACDPWRVNMVGTIHNVGTLFSMLIAGWMSDRFGRKPSIIFCAVCGCIGHLKALTTSYYIYISIEFLEAFLSGGINTAAMVFMIEISGRRYRILAGVMFAYAIYMAETILALIAMYVKYWKNLVRIIYSPPVLCICYIFLLKESPRWQILHGKTKNAKENIKLMAKMNKLNISHKELNDLDEQQLKDKFNIGQMEKKENLSKCFRSKEILIRLLVAMCCRFTAGFVYYGLMVNSVWLPGNKYTNFMLSTIMSYPGELLSLYAMNKVGRKYPLIFGLILSGVLTIASGLVPNGYTGVMIALFLLGKMIIALCFTGAVTYTTEIFPTSVRGTLLGTCAFAARFGGMLAPLSPMLMTVAPALPTICFGGSAMLSGVLLTLTPETKGMPLTDTIDQVNASAKLAKQKKEDLKKGKENLAYLGNEVSAL